MLPVNSSLFIQINKLLKENLEKNPPAKLKINIVKKKSARKENNSSQTDSIIKKLEDWIEDADALKELMLEEEQADLDKLVIIKSEETQQETLKIEITPKKKVQLGFIRSFNNVVNRLSILDLEVTPEVFITPKKEETKESIILARAFENLEKMNGEKKAAPILRKEVKDLF